MCIMYKNIIIPFIISIASFILMVGASVVGNFLSPRSPLPVRATILSIIFSLFLIFAFSLVPVMIWAVLRGNIYLWQKLPAPGNNLFQSFRGFVTQNEAPIFYSLLIFFWAIFALGLAAALPAMIKGGFFAAITDDAAIIKHGHNETIYQLKDSPIVLSVSSGVNEGVWRFRPRSAGEKSGQPIDRQIKEMDHLLGRALSDQKKPPRTLMAGRLEESFGGSQEISRRLVSAAKTSPLWDRIKGQGIKGDDNGAVKAILNEHNVYRELIDLFEKHGLVIAVSAVEKVLIGADKLPFDCQVWFSVEQKKFDLINAADNGRTVSVKRGEPIRLELAANATTGYDWQIEELAAEYFKVRTAGYRVDEVEPGREALGTGGISYWVIIPLKNGQSTIRLLYFRPWEGKDKAVEQFSVTILVK